MRKRSITGVLGTFLSLAGILLIVWWILLGLSQLSASSGASLAAMAMTPLWLPANIVGIIATVLLVVGLSAFFTRAAPDSDTLGFLATTVSMAGVLLFGALQFDETFVWPVLAQDAPMLLEPGGPMLGAPPFFAAYVSMGVLFAAGFILLTAHSIRRAALPLVLNLLLVFGALLFAGGVLVPVAVRTAGVLIFGGALIWAGLVIGSRPPTKEVK